MKRIFKIISGLEKKPKPEKKKVADIINPEEIKTVVDSRPVCLVQKREYTTPNNETKNMAEVAAIKGEETAEYFDAINSKWERKLKPKKNFKNS